MLYVLLLLNLQTNILSYLCKCLAVISQAIWRKLLNKIQTCIPTVKKIIEILRPQLSDTPMVADMLLGFSGMSVIAGLFSMNLLVQSSVLIHFIRNGFCIL